jgi:hypothetical protein
MSPTLQNHEKVYDRFHTIERWNTLLKEHYDIGYADFPRHDYSKKSQHWIEESPAAELQINVTSVPLAMCR